MNWKPGDRAIVFSVTGACSEYNGGIVYLTSFPYVDFDGALTVSIELFCEEFKKINVNCLHPIPPDEEMSWEDLMEIMDWHPQELVT